MVNNESGRLFCYGIDAAIYSEMGVKSKISSD